MNTKSISRLILLIGLSVGAVSAAPTSVPAPVVADTVPPPDQIVYTSELPNIADLTTGAETQGVTIKQIATSSVQTTVVYGYPDGKTKVVAYQLPPPDGADATLPLVSAPPPQVVYQLPPPVVGYPYDPAYPAYGYPAFAFRFGFAAGRRHWR